MKRLLWAIIPSISVTSFVASAVSRAVSASTPAATHDSGVSSLMGTIEGTDGKPMRGVAVTAQASDQTFKTTVFTDGKGEYVFPKLIAGDYKVWAQAVGLVTERATVNLSGTQTAHQDFTVKPLANFDAELSEVEWFASLPDDTVAHRQMKQVLYVACAGCHGFDVILNNKFDAAGRRDILKGMESADYEGYRGADDAPRSQLGWKGLVIRHHEADLVKFLTEMRWDCPVVHGPEAAASPGGRSSACRHHAI